jgi:hypothetical protein
MPLVEAALRGDRVHPAFGSLRLHLRKLIVLIVVSQFEEPSNEIFATIDALLHDYNVRHFQLENIQNLTDEIERSAH